MRELSGEQWLMNSWYEFLTLLESRNMLMNSGQSPNSCKVMTKVVMKYSWLAYSCSEAQRFIPVYIQHLWPGSESPLHVWKMVGACGWYKHCCRARTHRSASARLHRTRAPSQGNQDSWLAWGLQVPSYLQGKVHKQLYKHWPRESRRHREGANSIKLGNVSGLTLYKEQDRKTKVDEGNGATARPAGTERLRIR